MPMHHLRAFGRAAHDRFVDDPARIEQMLLHFYWVVALLHVILMSVLGIFWMAVPMAIVGCAWLIIFPLTWLAKRRLKTHQTGERIDTLWWTLFAQMLIDAGHHNGNNATYYPSVHGPVHKEGGHCVLQRDGVRHVLDLRENADIQAFAWTARRLARDTVLSNVWEKRAYTKSTVDRMFQTLTLPETRTVSAHEKLRISGILSSFDPASVRHA